MCSSQKEKNIIYTCNTCNHVILQCLERPSTWQAKYVHMPQICTGSAPIELQKEEIIVIIQHNKTARPGGGVKAFKTSCMWCVWCFSSFVSRWHIFLQSLTCHRGPKVKALLEQAKSYKGQWVNLTSSNKLNCASETFSLCESLWNLLYFVCIRFVIHSCWVCCNVSVCCSCVFVLLTGCSTVSFARFEHCSRFVFFGPVTFFFLLPTSPGLPPEDVTEGQAQNCCNLVQLVRFNVGENRTLEGNPHYDANFSQIYVFTV